MSKASQELIARLQEAMHNESAAHSPRTTFAIEAMRAAQTYIEAAAKREAVMHEVLGSARKYIHRAPFGLFGVIDAALAQEAKP